MRNKIRCNDFCLCKSCKILKKCCLIENDFLYSDEVNMMQIKEEVESKIGKKVKPLFIQRNCDIDAMKKAGLLEDMGDGLYRLKKINR